MGDPYWKYSAPPPAERSSFPGYLSSEASALTTHRPRSSTDSWYNSNIPEKDLLSSRGGEYPVEGIRGNHTLAHPVDDYGIRGIHLAARPLDDVSSIHPAVRPLDDVSCMYPAARPLDDGRIIHPSARPSDDIRGIHPEPSLVRSSGGASIRGYLSPARDPSLLEQRRDIAPAIITGSGDINYERPSSHKRSYDLPSSENDSNILFVDGLPTDCSRREVGHLFRPFIGFREIKVIHKEPRRSVDKPMVLCFVEFTDSKCALTAMEALQGYKFDDKKPDSGALKISFAHFPFRRASDRADQ